MSDAIKIKIDVTDEAWHKLSEPKNIYQELTLSPDLLYQHARTLLPQLLHLDGKDKTAMMMKVAIKGIFIAYGNTILEQLFKSKDHPKPQKGDDLVGWYIDLFTQILIMQAMKQEYTVEVNETAEIVGCVTRPIPEAATADNG